MLIFQLISRFAAALVAFGLAMGIVAGLRFITTPGAPPTEAEVPPSQTDINEKETSGVHFGELSPTKGNSSECLNREGEIYPFGWDTYLQLHQMPRIQRMARDGRWFFFETETDSGRSYEFFGVIPDSAGSASDKKKVAILGKLVRLTNGEITGNVDATYYVDRCVVE